MPTFICEITIQGNVHTLPTVEAETHEQAVVESLKTSDHSWVLANRPELFVVHAYQLNAGEDKPRRIVVSAKISAIFTAQGEMWEPVEANQ
jgi:hypothetical protein